MLTLNMILFNGWNGKYAFGSWSQRHLNNLWTADQLLICSTYEFILPFLFPFHHLSDSTVPVLASGKLPMFLSKLTTWIYPTVTSNQISDQIF
jgi:hypothetical protein